MNISELHRGLITRIAGQSKLRDLCTHPLQDMPASTRASLAKDMPASTRASLNREMHASGALKARRMHLLALKDAHVLHRIHANRGGAYLLPSRSSATGGSTPLRTKAGGSILPKIDPGVLFSQRSTLGVLFPHI